MALSLAVVIWGASYKMAEYPQQGCAFRVMEPAKLLTEKERPVRAGDSPNLLNWTVGQRSPLQHWPACVACIRRSALRARLSEALAPAARRRMVILPELTYFSFRPPPPRVTS